MTARDLAPVTPLSGRTLAWRSWLRALLVDDDPQLSDLDDERAADCAAPLPDPAPVTLYPEVDHVA